MRRQVGIETSEQLEIDAVACAPNGLEFDRLQPGVKHHAEHLAILRQNLLCTVEHDALRVGFGYVRGGGAS